MRRVRTVLLGVVLVVAAGCGLTLLAFSSDMNSARAAISGKSDLAQTTSGPIEYVDVGTGIPLLTIHGAGGGFDQGLANGEAMFGPGFRMIAPSRFGYLRTPVPADVSPAAQAEAHVALLDELGVSRPVVLGVSAGARSALEMALRHPERTRALVLVVPATYAPDTVAPATQRGADFPLMLWLVNAGADFAWWTLQHMAPDMITSFLGVPPEVVRAAAPDDQAAVAAMIRSILPLSERYAGINIDSTPPLAALALDSLDVPTLIISARDDLFDTLPPAEYAAARIPGARLVTFETGGHLLVGHRDEVRAAIADFLAQAGIAGNSLPTHVPLRRLTSP